MQYTSLIYYLNNILLGVFVFLFHLITLTLAATRVIDKYFMIIILSRKALLLVGECASLAV